MNKPEPKMPRGRQIRMIAVALTFEMLQTLCALLVVFAPVFVCYFAKYWVQSQVLDSDTVGDFACIVAGTGMLASYLVGVQVGIMILGWMLGMALSLLSLLIFTFWFMYARVGFLERGGTRLMMMAGGGILELVPFVNVLPWSTGSMWLLTQNVRKQDQEARAAYERWQATNEAANARMQAEDRLMAQTANDNEVEQREAA